MSERLTGVRLPVLITLRGGNRGMDGWMNDARQKGSMLNANTVAHSGGGAVIEDEGSDL